MKVKKSTKTSVKKTNKMTYKQFTQKMKDPKLTDAQKEKIARKFCDSMDYKK